MLAMALVSVSFAIEARASEIEQCATEAEHGSDLREAGKLRDARTTFEGCARESCPKIVRDDCREALAELREHAPHVTVRVRDPLGADLPQAHVTLDGVDVTADERTHGMLLDPGSHLVRASLEGYVAREQTLVVTINDGARAIELSLSPAKSISELTTTRRDRTAAIVVGSIGVAALSTFAVLGAFTYADYKHDQGGCAPSCSSSDVDGLRTRAHVADVALGIGVIALTTAVVLWFTAPTTRDAPVRTALVSW